MLKTVAQRHPRLTNLGILAASCVIALFLAEGVVRLFVPVRNIGPTFSEYDPVYGKRLKKSFHCIRTSPEFTMRFSTNSLRFRGAEPRSFPRNPVLFLGDSFTSGYGVNDGEEFPALVQGLLAADPIAGEVPVINAGSGNTGNGYWLKFLQTEARLYEPRLVVLQFSGNDFTDNLADRLYELDANGRLIQIPGSAPNETSRWAQRVLEAVPGLTSSHLVSLLKQLTSEVSIDPCPDTLSVASAPDPCEHLALAIVRAVLEECERQRWPVLVVTADLKGRRRALLSSLLADVHVPCLHIPTKAERPDLYYTIDGHWTAEGHRFVARQVFEAIQHHQDQPLHIPSLLTHQVHL